MTSVFFLAFLLSIVSIAKGLICGKVDICVELVGGALSISMDMELTSALPGTLTSVDAAGYMYNFGSDESEILTSPGDSPVLDPVALTYSDAWTRPSVGGDIQVGFPFMRAYDSSDEFCHGSFRMDFVVTNGGAKQCEEVDMLREENVDFALVVDSTGSMWDDIDQVKVDAHKIVDTLYSISTSFRGAVVEYNDRSGIDATIVESLTSNVPDVRNAIDSLTASGGGDYPECLYDALMLTLALPWDYSARRITITMGDAPGKVCESGITLADVIGLTSFVDIVIDISPSVRTKLQKAGRQVVEKEIKLKVPVKKLNPLYMVPIGSGATSSFSDIANKTEGGVFPAKDSTEVVGAIIDAIKGESPKDKTKDLIVKLDCKGSTKDTHKYVIENPNDFDVPFKYQDLVARVRGTGTAKPGRNEVNVKKARSVYFTLRWTKHEGGGDGSLVFTSRPC